MEQVNNSMVLDLMQAVAAQSQPPKTGGKDKGDGDFRKMMEKAAGSGDARTEDAPSAEQAPAARPEKAPVQKQESSLERIKRLLEQGAIALQLNISVVTLDGQVYQPKEYVEVWTATGVEFIPITDLDEAQLQELQQLLSSVTTRGRVDVSDPEADAMLEATDPTVDHSPAALLERVTAEQFGKAADTAAQKVRPETGRDEEEQSDDPMMEIIDARQAPQPLFHDVKAAPVKVGEVDRAAGTEETNVVRQVDSGIAQALEKGESMVRIQLNPENLGSVTVEITRSAEGVIRVALTAHSSETRGLLERHAGELQGLLGSRTQQSVEVSVQRQQESQQNQNHNYDGRSGHSQDGGQHRRRQQEQTDSVDFIQQLRLGLIPADGEE